MAPSEPRQALQLVGQEALQVWLPSTAAAKHAAELSWNAQFVPHTIDPRLWRDYHRPWRNWVGGPAQFLAILGPGSEPDLTGLVAALAPLFSEGDARLTVVTTSPVEPQPSWLTTLRPDPIDWCYPRFAHWLRSQGPFQFGLACGTNGWLSQDAADQAFLEFSALGMVSILPAPTLDQAVVSKTMALAAVGEQLVSLARQAITNPQPLRAIAAAAVNHTWKNRSTPSRAERVSELIEEASF